ncbi:MAG: Ig-like domain-containing protein [Coriobacteriia bacterium]|jgi:hypothetical protein|nr:Ig-like domain-containing protein [Coriobacteriia bacterium]
MNKVAMKRNFSFLISFALVVSLVFSNLFIAQGFALQNEGSEATVAYSQEQAAEVLPEVILFDDAHLIIEPGDTAVIKATVLPEDATDKTLVWSSDNPAVATVSESGLVSAVSTGITTITATAANGITTKITVVVAIVFVCFFDSEPTIWGEDIITATEGYVEELEAIYVIDGGPKPDVTLDKNTAGATLAEGDNTYGEIISYGMTEYTVCIPTGLSAGTYEVTVVASNDLGLAEKTVTVEIFRDIIVDINPPSISGQDVITATAGYDKELTATYEVVSTPLVELKNNSAGARIVGTEQFDTGTVVIAYHVTLGIPTGLKAGTYEVTLEAGMYVGDPETATKTVTVQINPAPVTQPQTKPTITGPSTINATVGYSKELVNAYRIAGNPQPTASIKNNTAEASFFDNTLYVPTGLGVGTYKVTITAKSSQGSVEKVVTVRIDPKPAKPAISGKAKIALKKGYKKTSAFYQIKGFPVPELTIKAPKSIAKKVSISKSGKLTIKKGIKKGTYKITIKATNSQGSKTKTIKIVVK